MLKCLVSPTTKINSQSLPNSLSHQLFCFTKKFGKSWLHFLNSPRFPTNSLTLSALRAVSRSDHSQWLLPTASSPALGWGLLRPHGPFSLMAPWPWPVGPMAPWSWPLGHCCSSSSLREPRDLLEHLVLRSPLMLLQDDVDWNHADCYH